jgi:hypothetical protein
LSEENGPDCYGLWEVDSDGDRHVDEDAVKGLRYGQRKLENLGIPQDLQLNRPFLG